VQPCMLYMCCIRMDPVCCADGKLEAIGYVAAEGGVTSTVVNAVNMVSGHPPVHHMCCDLHLAAQLSQCSSVSALPVQLKCCTSS
jgi:hypothetical protein